MPPSLVVVRAYANEYEAELARATLEVNGIDAIVQRNDAAGLLRAVEPASLVVRGQDAERALAVLDAPPSGERGAP